MFRQKEVRIPTIRRKTWTIVATSIKIKPEVWKQAKIEAIRRDMELSELVEQAIEAWLGDDGGKGEKQEMREADKLSRERQGWRQRRTESLCKPNLQNWQKNVLNSSRKPKRQLMI